MTNTGLEAINRDQSSVQRNDKRMLNSKIDVNQLKPFKYPWAWDKYLAGLANHWMPTEITMAQDVALWKSEAGLTAAERKAFENFLAFAVISDTAVGNNIVFVIYRFITNPECRQYIIRQLFDESVHVYSYQHIIESLSLDEGRVYNRYREVPYIADKIDWALSYTRDLADPNFKTGTPSTDRAFLKNLIAFYVIYEGLFFYVGFVSTFALGRRNKMTGSAEQFQYIFRDESMHVNFGIDVINQIKHENPNLWTSAFQSEVKRMIQEGVDLEANYAKHTMPTGILGLNAESFRDYLEYIANRRCVQLGLSVLYAQRDNPFPWMSEMLDLKKEKNFFETRVTEYQTGGALVWDDEE